MIPFPGYTSMPVECRFNACIFCQAAVEFSWFYQSLTRYIKASGIICPVCPRPFQMHMGWS